MFSQVAFLWRVALHRVLNPVFLEAIKLKMKWDKNMCVRQKVYIIQL